MWTGEEGGVDGVVEEGVGGGDEDRMGGEGCRPEVQEYGVGRVGPLDRSADFTVPADGSNMSGGLRLPLGKTEPLNQPSGNTPPPWGANVSYCHFKSKKIDAFEIVYARFTARNARKRSRRGPLGLFQRNTRAILCHLFGARSAPTP